MTKLPFLDRFHPDRIEARHLCDWAAAPTIASAAIGTSALPAGVSFASFAAPALTSTTTLAAAAAPTLAGTLAAAAPFATLAGGALSAIGALKAGSAQKAMLEYNAAVAENDAIAARQQAELDERRHRRQGAALLSRQRAVTAGSGVEVEGSPLLAMSDSMAEIEEDAQLIRLAGDTRSQRLRSQAALDRMQGRAARTGSFFSAGGALLGAAGTAGSGIARKTLLSA